jgi:hypothetical protein
MTCKVRHWVLNNQWAYAILTGLLCSRTCQVQFNLLILQDRMMDLTGLTPELLTNNQ